jgi:hypothetical protein
VIFLSKTTPADCAAGYHGVTEDAEKNNPIVSINQLEREVELSLKDINPFRPIWTVLRRVNNLVILFSSGA